MTKETRLIINFTAAQYVIVQEVYKRSELDSESEFLRRSVELFVKIYSSYLSGGKLLSYSADGKTYEIDIPEPQKKRERSKTTVEKSPQEIRIQPITLELLRCLVKSEHACNITALFRASVILYKNILGEAKQGKEIRLVSDEKEEVVHLLKFTEKFPHNNFAEKLLSESSIKTHPLREILQSSYQSILAEVKTKHSLNDEEAAKLANQWIKQLMQPANSLKSQPAI